MNQIYPPESVVGKTFCKTTNSSETCGITSYHDGLNILKGPLFKKKTTLMIYHLSMSNTYLILSKAKPMLEW